MPSARTGSVTGRAAAPEAPECPEAPAPVSGCHVADHPGIADPERTTRTPPLELTRALVGPVAGPLRAVTDAPAADSAGWPPGPASAWRVSGATARVFCQIWKDPSKPASSQCGGVRTPRRSDVAYCGRVR